MSTNLVRDLRDQARSFADAYNEPLESLVEWKAAERIEKLEKTLKKIGKVPAERHTSGHLHECPWCSGSASLAAAAMKEEAAFNPPSRK